MQERGIPLEKQLRNWSGLNVKPYDKNNVDPYTQCRAITLYGVEIEANLFSHQFARHTTDMDIKRQLAAVRRIEQQQQKAVNWLTPGEASTLEVTIGYEQVAVDLTAQSNREYVRKVLESEINLSADQAFFVPMSDLPADHRYHQYQAAVHGHGPVPSEEVIKQHRERAGNEYRVEPLGEHPIPSARQAAE